MPSRADNESAMSFIGRIENWNRALSLSIAFALIAVIGVLDHVTDSAMSFSVFYLLPLALLAWKGGRWLGLVGALVCTVVWAAAGQTFSNWFAVYWNTGSRFLSFALMAFLLSSLQVSHAHLESLSRTDPLTGCSNTRAFMEQLKSEINRARRYGRPLTLAYMDLDNFKIVNDTLGHSEGDAVLKAVVSTLRANIRTTDILGRLGGDEFALVLPETDRSAAQTALGKIRTGILQEMGSKGWPVTMSVGAVTCLEGCPDPEAMIKKADDNMYEAKLTGKNTIRLSSVPE
jgi:diguanylate cyclase (GGDEF)-like protein